ncbi:MULTISPECIES: DsbA family protein [unclassified Luteococcus]|uniref:DsbA family protein n=1 Tax=unclassified Luteococcus TaxID=2639923 RepID=UPI00313B5BB1
MGKPSPASRRAALQAQREQALAAQRRGRIIGGIVGATLAVLMVAGGAWWWNQSRKPEPVPVGKQLAVPHASADGSGITLHKSPAGKPTLVIYEDYQCPWCKVAHDALGPLTESLARKGEIGVEVRSLTLLDGGSNDSSYRANIGAACADVVGAYAGYRDAIFAKQPAKEGDGYSDELLTGLLDTLTLKDPGAFQTCYRERQTDDAVQRVLDAARAADRDTSSPQYWVADASGAVKNQLDLKALMGQRDPSEAELLAAIKAAA